MADSQNSIYFPQLDYVIDRCPLIVSPDTLLLDVIALMGKGPQSCLVDVTNPLPHLKLMGDKSSSCVLVMEGDKLLGIFTERDAVRLSAESINFKQVSIAEVMTAPVLALHRPINHEVFTALSLFHDNGIRHLPVFNSQNQLEGVITFESIRRILQPVNLLKLRQISEIMTREVLTAPRNASVLTVAQMQAQHQVSCVVIAQKDLHAPEIVRPVGIITERDIVNFQIQGMDLGATEVQNVMTSPVFCMHPEASLWQANEEMQRRSVRRLVVVGKHGEMLGMLTETSLMRAFDSTEVYRVVGMLEESVEKRTYELARTNKALQSEIVKRQQIEEELRQSLEKEKELSELKSRFASMVSHEFRNPLNAIMMSAGLLENYSQKLTGDQRDQLLQGIQSTATQMTQMIEDLLLICRSEAGKIEFRPTLLNLEQFCQYLLEEIQMTDNNLHPIQFTVEGAAIDATIDQQILRHILNNLLSNACKYSPIGTPVSLTVKCEEKIAIFEIRDRGIGIPPQDQIKLFETFYRAKNVGNIPGTGLGLSIVKQYVNLHGGTISFHSEVGVGTTFKVSLPVSQDIRFGQ